MFAFVYVWYLMAVLLLEIWFDYRGDLIRKAKHETGAGRAIDRFLALYTSDVSPKAIAFDKKAVYGITVIGIPSAFLLHGYVGFIFGSVKANPWWSSVLMPIVFLFSAIVSGIALMLLIYMVASLLRKEQPDIHCLDKLAGFLFYIMIVDFALEGLDVVQRVYQSEESIKILSQLIEQRLFTSLVVVQLIFGMLVPLAGIAMVKIFAVTEDLRRMVYFIVALLVQVGILSTRWNVVIGGQLFSKSFRGLTTYKIAVGGVEGLVAGTVFLILPFIILYLLCLLFPPFPEKEKGETV